MNWPGLTTVGAGWDGAMAKLEKLVARAEPILARLVLNASMVVIGVFAADLAVYLLERRQDITWLGVDSWLGTEHQPQAYKDSGDVHAAMSQAQQDELLALSRARLKRFGDRATICHMDSLEAAKLFEPESVDLAFIDADHSEAGTARDIEAWWPLV